MQPSIKAGMLVPALKQTSQTLVLLSLLALLALLGASLCHFHQAAAPTGVWMAPATGGTSSTDRVHIVAVSLSDKASRFDASRILRDSCWCPLCLVGHVLDVVSWQRAASWSLAAAAG